jgi:hypothetical protein
MKTITKCCDECSESCVCESTVVCRPRYFPRQLITPEEMILEAQYFRHKIRNHNRMMHGWGVVCGAVVCRAPKCKQPESDQAQTSPDYEPWKVLVEPGYILGPCGDEIIIQCNQTVDLRKQGGTSVSGDPCPEEVDPWCSDPETTPHERTLYVAVKYKEIMTRPIRVQPVGCGCDDMPCEYSRWCDGYEFGFLSECPSSHIAGTVGVDTMGFVRSAGEERRSLTEREGQAASERGLQMASERERQVASTSMLLPLSRLALLLQGAIPDCPPCPTSPWVVLAKVSFDQSGVIKSIDNCECRRIVISFGNFWWTCSEPCHPKDMEASPTPERREALVPPQAAAVGPSREMVERVARERRRARKRRKRAR